MSQNPIVREGLNVCQANTRVCFFLPIFLLKGRLPFFPFRKMKVLIQIDNVIGTLLTSRSDALR